MIIHLMKTRIIVYAALFLVVVTVSLWLFWRPYGRFLQVVAGVSFKELLLEKGNLSQSNGKVNFLLLGKAGGFFEGPDLTDSMMFVSIDLRRRKINLVTLPRDVWSPVLHDKINTAYYYGKQQKKRFSLVQSEVERIVGLPVHYTVLIDFDRFEDLIDYLGGLTVYVERSFDDFKYPLAGKTNDLCGGDPTFACRYEHISFQKGWSRIDGATALKFTRSRNAKGDEGTDFARGKRQQKVMTALYETIRERLQSLNMQEFYRLYFLLDALIERNIPNKDMVYLLKEIILRQPFSFREITLAPAFFLVPPYENYQGKYVLVPRTGDFTALHNYVVCMIEEEPRCESYIPITKQTPAK